MYIVVAETLEKPRMYGLHCSVREWNQPAIWYDLEFKLPHPPLTVAAQVLEANSNTNPLVFHLHLSQEQLVLKYAWAQLKGQMSMWRPKKMSGHAIVNVIFTWSGWHF
jgi:hypothetical protein